MFSKPISDLVEQFQQLPGIGPKSAQRLTYYLLRRPQEDIDQLLDSIQRIKTDLTTCTQCYNITEQNPCPICSDSQRIANSLCVVEEPLDLFAIEKTKKHTGHYHVLGGVVNPLMGVGPEELRIHELIQRIRLFFDQNYEDSFELILATNPSMEGEATAMYIRKLLQEDERVPSDRLTISRIARGLPTGGDVEYADQITLARALDGRVPF
ncbi:recombination protein RecR [candidate division WWE3 bacterium]|uniref:Recombination protein RecR n=1 Tax=candidate division WWE3 bacterium TaxID=2053526 RepID=A0A955LHI9_UNCKA|nr:recombination protein RecR [candidate division WWE3 bacterium]